VYSLEYNNYWRSEASEDFVEGRYGEVLDAASLGDEFFNQFLQSKGITHVLIPESTSVRGQVFNKWGERGSTNIDLNSRFLRLLRRQVVHLLRRCTRCEKVVQILITFHIAD
jgi:hypothetical protein